MKAGDLNDIHKLLISFFVVFVIAKLVFFQEDVLMVLKVVSSLFWLFVLPGFGITYLWRLRFIERFVLSIALGSAVVGIGSYYLGLIGLHVAYSSYVLPTIFILIGFAIVFRERIRKFVHT